jgi:hypothetical protein
MSANILFIFPSIDKAHAYPIVVTNLVKLLEANTVTRGYNGYWSKDESSNVSPVATSVDVWRLVNNNQHTFVTKMH